MDRIEHVYRGGASYDDSMFNRRINRVATWRMAWVRFGSFTGAGRGIGAQIAKAALAVGDRVVATGRNAAHMQQMYGGYGDKALGLALDATREQDAIAAVEVAQSRFGGIDVLVNNAGYGQLGLFEEITGEDVERQFQTNVFGMMHVTRAVLPVMRRQRRGHVLNLSSIGGLAGFDGASIYCASKFAVEGFSESLAPEVASFGIRVTIVEPGFFRTDFLDKKSIQYGSRKGRGLRRVVRQLTLDLRALQPQAAG